MVFFAQKVLRTVAGQLDVRDGHRPHGARRPDRQDVQGDAARSTDRRARVPRASGAHLRELLRGRPPLRLHADPQVPDAGACRRCRSLRSRDVIVITDEAHRSQYDTLALNMRAALPNAAFIGFTGTPLIAGEERTREVFGDYVSIYNFRSRSRTARRSRSSTRTGSPSCSSSTETSTTTSDDAPRGGRARRGRRRSSSQRQFGRAVPPASPATTGWRRSPRTSCGTSSARVPRQGDGRRPSTRRPPCACTTRCRSTGSARRRELSGLAADAYGTAASSERAELQRAARASWRRPTWRVVVSPGAERDRGPEASWASTSCRTGKRMLDRRRSTSEFKDPDDPLRLVFVCAMWMTGLRRAELLDDLPRQADAEPHADADDRPRQPGVPRQAQRPDRRLRRRVPSLEKALAIYGQGPGRHDSGPGQTAAGRGAAEAVEAVTGFCTAQSVNLAAIEARRRGLDRLAHIADAVNRLITPDPLRKEFLAHERWVNTLYQAVKPDPAVCAVSGRVSASSA